MKVVVIATALVFLHVAALHDAAFVQNSANNCTAEECHSYCPRVKNSRCKDPCTRTGPHCVKSCESKNCEVRCGSNSTCFLLCSHKSCKRINTFGGKACHHICIGECPRVECSCKECYFYKYYSADAPPLSKNYFYCNGKVQQCHLVCDNSTCLLQSFGKYVEGNVVNKGNAFFELAETVRRIKLDCEGNSSLCMLLQRLNTTEYQSLCHKDCGYTVIYQTHYFHTERRLLITKMIDQILQQKQRHPERWPDSYVRDAFAEVSKFIKSPKKQNDWYFHDLKVKEYPTLNQPSHKPTLAQTLQGDGSTKKATKRNSGHVRTKQTSLLGIILNLLQLLFLLANQD